MTIKLRKAYCFIKMDEQTKDRFIDGYQVESNGKRLPLFIHRNADFSNHWAVSHKCGLTACNLMHSRKQAIELAEIYSRYPDVWQFENPDNLPSGHLTEMHGLTMDFITRYNIR